MKNIPLTLIAIASVLLVAACSKLTDSNLQKVHNGMTTDEVKAILGAPTDIKSTDALGLSGTTYTYHTNSSDVRISFFNNKVIATEGDFK